jgi:hypothetical protein
VVVEEHEKTLMQFVTPEAGMMMKKASGGDSPLRQGVGKSFWTLSISRRRRRRLAVCFKEN